MASIKYWKDREEADLHFMSVKEWNRRKIKKNAKIMLTICTIIAVILIGAMFL